MSKLMITPVLQDAAQAEYAIARLRELGYDWIGNGPNLAELEYPLVLSALGIRIVYTELSGLEDDETIDSHLSAHWALSIEGWDEDTGYAWGVPKKLKLDKFFAL